MNHHQIAVAVGCIATWLLLGLWGSVIGSRNLDRRYPDTAEGLTPGMLLMSLGGPINLVAVLIFVLGLE